MIESPFNRLFRSEFLESKSNVMTKSIKLCPDCIEKVDIYLNRSILYQNCLKLIKKVWINWLFIHISIFDLLIDNFDLLIDSFDYLINLYQSYNQKEIKNDRFKSKIDWIYFKIMIVETISSLESELELNWRSNLDSLKSESSMIGFIVPHCLSLVSSWFEPIRTFWPKNRPIDAHPE